MKKIILFMALIGVLIFTRDDTAKANGEFLVKMEKPDTSYNGKILKLDAKNKRLVEELVQGEAGGEGYVGAVFVAQCIRDHMVRDNTKNATEIRTNHGFSAEFGTSPNEDVKKAVKFVFDEGGSAIQHRILYYYAAKPIFGSTGSQYITGRKDKKVWKDVTDEKTYPMHEGKNTEYLFTYKGHKFFDELASSATKITSRKGYNIIIYSKDYAWDKVNKIKIEKDKILSEFDTVSVDSISATDTESSALDIIWGDIEYSSLGNYVVEVAGMEGLSLNERMSIDTFKRDISNSTTKSTTFVRIAYLVFGILAIGYSFLLFSAYWFDRYNILFEVDLLKILSFGKLVITPDEDDTPDRIEGSVCVNLKKIIVILITGVFLGGIVVLSGKGFSIIQSFINIYRKFTGLF